MKVLLGILSVFMILIGCEDVASISSAETDSVICCAETASVENVTADELESLTFMVEEEKLARDVYITLYEEWGQKSFNNISGSEQKHMDAVKNLLELYEQEIPVTLETVGSFENEVLQSMYNDLVTQGKTSLIEALKVGALIEEVDIIDLVDLQETIVQEDTIEYVFANLISGSENHLRAFVKNLGQQGVTYEPQLLDTETYQAIVN